MSQKEEAKEYKESRHQDLKLSSIKYEGPKGNNLF
jgi:hypothetical protein